MAYQRKKRKVRRHRQPDRVAMAKRKRERKKVERAINPDVQFARLMEAKRQRTIATLAAIEAEKLKRRTKRSRKEL
jgi:hypothetical protein